MFRNFYKRSIFMALAAVIVFVMTGCSTTTRDISPDASMHYDESYDFSDKNAIVDYLVESLVNKPPLVARDDRPVIIIYDVANRTTEHIETDGITDDIRREIMQSGKARFVNKVQRDNIQRETNYQYGGNVSAETRLTRARQVGAEYMISGTLRSITSREGKGIRMKRDTRQYYSLTLELTDLQTGLIEWADSAEIARESSKPFIGW